MPLKSATWRSAQSACEIKHLIELSANHVEKGTGLVNTSGQLLSEIRASSHQVSALLDELSTATRDQNERIQDSASSVSSVESVVQANTAMVEEVAASAEILLGQTNGLMDQVTQFRISQNHSRPRSSRSNGAAQQTNVLELHS